MPPHGFFFGPQPMGGLPVAVLMFLWLVGFVFVFAIGSAIVKALGGAAEWGDNNNRPAEKTDASVVSKRSEISSIQNSTSTSYFVTFELPGGVRKEFKLEGSEFGLLAEGDNGQLSCQGTRYLGFERNPASEPEPEPAAAAPFPASRVCDYCGSAIPDTSLKCGGCGWTWHPSHQRPVES